MRILEAKAHAHHGKLSSAANANRQWDERIGVLLAVLTDGEHLGAGEATPLPGYSPESYIHAWSALQAWAEAAAGRELFDLDDVAATVSLLPANLPSVRFAVETALLDVLAQSEGCSIADLLVSGDYGPGSSDADAPTPSTLPIAALVSVDGPGSGDSIVTARRHLDRGVAALKVKIGREGRFDAERRGLKALRSTLGEDWELRLDANGALPIASAAERLEALTEVEPAFIEEPLSGGDLFVLSRPAIPVALDETFRAAHWSHLEKQLATWRCRAVVLKPTVQGGVLACLEKARDAVTAGLDVVVSHTFEGAVALQAASHLAWALARRGVPVAAHGLARHAGLEAWPEATGLLVGEGAIAAPCQPGLGIDDPAQQP